MSLLQYQLPDRETLENIGGYTEEEVDILSEAAAEFNVMSLAERKQLGRVFLRELWPDPYVFAEKTHWILDNRPTSPTFAQLVRLVPNYAQKEFINILRAQQEAGLPLRVIILKARQLGFSTFVQSWQYNQCDLFANRSSLTISYDEDSTKEMFQKAVTIKRQQWMPQQARRDSGNLIELANGSKFHTATAGKLSAGRSFTIHHLHCSEVPMWPNATEVLTSVLQSVAYHKDTSIFLESTAKGAVGSFYEMWLQAEKGQSTYVPFFAPWYWDPEYVYHFPTEQQAHEWARAHLKPEDIKYQKAHKLTIGQMAWRFHKTMDGCEGHPLRFRQEFPATAREAFLSSGSPRFSPDLVDALTHQCSEPSWCGSIGPA